MGRIRVYVKPFEEDGTYQDDWIEITDDVEAGGVSSMKQSLDNGEYDIGIFTNSGVGLSLINSTGRFSDVGEPGSIFKYRRSNSLVKITWTDNEADLICGFFRCGHVVMTEETIAFEGLLDDTALKQDADNQNLKFKVQGKESIFEEEIVPIADVAIGQTFSELIYTLLNQTQITTLLTIDQANIVCGVDEEVDVVSHLENKTVREALEEILLSANSVLYLLDDVVYVGAREESAALMHSFYGPGAVAGNENIISITDFRIGLNRLFNFVTWTDTTLVSEDLSSITAYGYRKKDLKTDLITDNTKRGVILDSICDEFKNPKRELILRTPIDHDTIALKVLDKVQIDYPNVGVNPGTDIPLWDSAIYDEAVYPYEILPIAIEDSARFKILSRDIDPSNQEMVFYCREI